MEKIITRASFIKALLREANTLNFGDYQRVLDFIKSVKEESERDSKREEEEYPEAHTLADKASWLAQMYFEDMLFEKDSIVEKFTWLADADQKNGILYDILPTELRGPLSDEVDNYKYVVGAVEGGGIGQADIENHTVTIDPDHTDDDSILLHELIHVFELFYEANTGFLPLRDALLIALYNDLKGKLSSYNPIYPDADLDGLILERAYSDEALLITRQGGEHSVLFHLKSLDLDLRLGYPLGTVFGYRRQDADRELGVENPEDRENE